VSHLIDESNGRYNIAYADEVPWHGHGTKVDPYASVEEWAEAGGLTHKVEWAPVEYLNHKNKVAQYPNRGVLYRTDTGAPLSIVSESYKIVQPIEVLNFFRKLAKANKMRIETVGSLKGGAKIWAQAVFTAPADVVYGDTLVPRVLCATSYDKTLCTTAKYVVTRVVCDNTITMALSENTAGISIPHSEKVDFDKVRLNLGLAATKWEEFVTHSRYMAQIVLNDEEPELLLVDMMPPVKGNPVQETKAFKRVMEMFEEGSAKGARIPGVRGTAWDLLNCYTEYIDHERGHTNNRLHSAWFGEGEKMKMAAFDAVLAFCD